MRLLMLAVLLSISSLARAQQVDTFQDENSLCNGAFADANATGIPLRTRLVLAGNLPNNATPVMPSFTWAQTLFENATSEQTTLWLDIGSANYSDDYRLYYDVCAFAVTNTTQQTDYRGMQDNGTCLSAFDLGCVEAFNKLASSTADSLVTDRFDGGPDTNLTGDALPRVCEDLAMTIESRLPKECKPFYEKTVSVTPYRGSALHTADVVAS
ncbi:hypothetical protein LTR97_002711 [Elasticomyces elasticus]|uniref:Uncharacterized protein n=1 Tax=Elasticomyces elasticus TaxID=574655 RepID=A0AAN7VUW9_9PEZI|nr:hypothetical protein LTR97_002711 [Elasticomyces elasticus]